MRFTFVTNRNSCVCSLCTDTERMSSLEDIGEVGQYMSSKFKVFNGRAVGMGRIIPTNDNLAQEFATKEFLEEIYLENYIDESCEWLSRFGLHTCALLQEKPVDFLLRYQKVKPESVIKNNISFFAISIFGLIDYCIRKKMTMCLYKRRELNEVVDMMRNDILKIDKHLTVYLESYTRLTQVLKAMNKLVEKEL